MIAGKDEYLSPEQARCEVTDHRADLFCCGIVMAELMLDTIFLRKRIPIKPFVIFWNGHSKIQRIRPDVDDRLNNIYIRPSIAPANQDANR